MQPARNCVPGVNRISLLVNVSEEAELGELLHTAHWAVRYLVLLAALAAALLALLGWSRAAAHQIRHERLAMTAFVGFLDVQLLLGLLLLLSWPYYPMLIGHIVMMVLAAAVAHAGSIVARRREPARSGSPIRLAAVCLALVLVVGGIMAIQRPVLF
jgi:hypothetical protein